jgi:hypothetical protein
MRTTVAESLLIRSGTRCIPHQPFYNVLLEPDFLQRDRPLAQETDLHAIHIGLIEEIEHIVVLGNPWRIRSTSRYRAIRRSSTNSVLACSNS